jgi:formate dehydrogenase major subunit
MKKQRTICGYCGVGCSVEFALSPDKAGQPQKIVYAQGFPEGAANGEFLCAKGRYGWDFVSKPDRLTEPLIRKDLAYQLGLIADDWTVSEQTVLKGKGDLANYIPVSWEQATEIVATKLADIIKESGGDAVAGLTSARCTNEENYLFQKFFRATVGTNNIDHCARL